jgi:6-phosphogluconolactonase
MKIGLLLLLLLPLAAYAREKQFLVYVGTYTDSGSKGIYAFRFDSATGKLSPIGLAAETDAPSFLAVDPANRFLYAANELDEFQGKSDGAISVYAIDRKSGALTRIQQVSSGGWGPVYLSFDKQARHLLVANYGAGNIAVFAIDKDGKLGSRTALVQHEGSKENPPRPHSVKLTTDDRFALVPDLALEQMFVYRFDSAKGSLVQNDPKSAAVNRGSGPRHFAIAPTGKFVYLGEENSSEVTVFSFDPRNGALHQIQAVSTLPPGYSTPNTTAEVLLDAKGRFLYVSNRGEDTIVRFAVDPTNGKLTFVDRTPTGGKTPRGFAFDPTGNWLLAGNQASNTITVFRVDPASGQLTSTGESAQVVSPVYVLFVPQQ